MSFSHGCLINRWYTRHPAPLFLPKGHYWYSTCVFFNLLYLLAENQKNSILHASLGDWWDESEIDLAVLNWCFWGSKIHFSMVFSKSVVDGFLTIDFYWQFLQISPARCIDVKPQISCSWGMLCHGSSQRENMFSKRRSVLCRSRLTFLAFRGSPHPVPSGSVAAKSSLVEFESFPVSCCHCPFHEFYHAWRSLEIIGDHWSPGLSYWW